MRIEMNPLSLKILSQSQKKNWLTVWHKKDKRIFVYSWRERYYGWIFKYNPFSVKIRRASRVCFQKSIGWHPGMRKRFQSTQAYHYFARADRYLKLYFKYDRPPLLAESKKWRQVACEYFKNNR